MWAVIVMIIICIIVIFALWWYYKKIVPGKMYYVGKTYADPNIEPFTNHLFKTRSGKKDHTYYYVVTKLTENVNGVPAGTTLLFDEFKEPEKGDLCLFEQDKKLRVGICLATGKLRYEPNIYDGHEAPGLGCELIGVARYAAGE